MIVSRERIVTLCHMARDGARDDAGREFAMGMLEEFREAWKIEDEENNKKLTARIKAEVDTRVESQTKTIEERVRAEFTEMIEKKESIPQAPQIESPPQEGQEQKQHENGSR